MVKEEMYKLLKEVEEAIPSVQWDQPSEPIFGLTQFIGRHQEMSILTTAFEAGPERGDFLRYDGVVTFLKRGVVMRLTPQLAEHCFRLAVQSNG